MFHESKWIEHFRISFIIKNQGKGCFQTITDGGKYNKLGFLNGYFIK